MKRRWEADGPIGRDRHNKNSNTALASGSGSIYRASTLFAPNPDT
jgi:hypothetical protein